MAVNLDQQHAAFERQERSKIGSIGHDHQCTVYEQQQASSSDFEVCGVFAPALHNPPLQPRGENPLDNPQYHCPRCDTTYSRSLAVKQHFPRCIETNGNPDSLRWFDHESNNLTVTRNLNTLKAAITPSKHKRSALSIASLLADEPEAFVVMNKVDKWAAMAAEKQAATVASMSNKSNGIGTLATHIPTPVTASIMDTSSRKDTSVVKKPAKSPTTAPKQGSTLAIPAARDQFVTLAGKQPEPRPQKPRKRRAPNHGRDTAHLFNNAGVLMPSIPGIDIVTERLFDKGEIMSLGPSRSHDSYYPVGEPLGGSFLLDHSSDKKRKRDNEN
ncbi:hypothetical protein HO133_001904 [Letharia lupina]|uniref:Uncharacterized protein n=1 Tax=Letharia lupina TaxID=560253 RepID=A0A8H6CEW8_9LECA|nr:uncharacterized protein HO133_001904 [Letharia lupina]KAF6221936.1 hypothetical protein HO133_001904 [Letharia lupina]